MLPAATTFDYSLPASHRPYWTSAGVFKADGTLVRTLWRKEIKNGGVYSASWDDRDDVGSPTPTGTYELRVLHHQIDYVWDGALGNTSAERSGQTVHGSYEPIRDIAIAGTLGFYVADYNEASYTYHSFLTPDPLRLTDRWTWVQDIRAPGQAGYVDKQPNSISDRSWSFTATDGAWVYVACPSSTDPSLPYPRDQWDTYKGFVTASDAVTHAQVYFTNGQLIPNGGVERRLNADGTYTSYEGYPFFPYPNGVHVGTQRGLSGMAVQASGNVLAIAVAPDNKIYLLHKRTGATLGEIAIPSPRRIAFASNGDLWACSATSVLRYTAVETSPTLAGAINGLAKPLAVAVDPSSDLVLVADGGPSQQLKGFTAAGDPLWTYGIAGGQPARGINIASDVFWFVKDPGSFEAGGTVREGDTFVTFQPDGSFWVGDAGNWRTLHFSPSRSLLHTLAYQPLSYSCGVDLNNPTRVFSHFLEFSVDYSKSLTQGWQLVRNWAATLGSGYFGTTATGIRTVTTLSNGRTYAKASSYVNNVEEARLVELTSTGIRPTSTVLAYGESLAADGTRRKMATDAPNWTQRRLTGFAANGDPIYGTSTFLASASSGPLDPVPYSGVPLDRRVAVTSSDIVISYDPVDSAGSPQVAHNNFHLGGIRVGGSSWLWRASPAVAALDNRGGFEVSTNSLTYAGNTALSVGRHVVYGYHGEFFRNRAQAGQFMHWWDDGLFLGQFGESNLDHDRWEGKPAGFAGNGLSPEFVRAANGEYYVYTNEENGNGVQRWHLAGTQTIRELTGQVSPGGTVTLAAAGPAFPAITSLLPGNARATLTWSEVPGAASYRVRHGVSDGGPYEHVVEVLGTTATIGGLPNGVPHYFTVSAVVTASEGAASAQGRVFPFNTSGRVQLGGAWRTTLRPIVYKIDSTAPVAGRSAVTAQVQAIGDVTIPEVFHRSGSDGQLPVLDFGKRGYAFFNQNGSGGNTINAIAPFTVTRPTSGWVNDKYFTFLFHIDGALQPIDYGVKTTTSAAVSIGASDSGPADWHCLTVALPRQFANARHAILGLTSSGQSAEYNTGPQKSANCLADVVQFLFRGPSTLTLQKGATADNAALQGLFLDDVALTTALTPLETWKSEKLGDASAPDAADLDGDGFSTLAEYALGSSPMVADAAAFAPTIKVVAGGAEDFLDFTFARDPARHDIDYFVEVSTDLVSWLTVAEALGGLPTTGAGYLSGDSSGAGVKQVTVRVIVPISEASKRFMRLKIRLH